MSGSWWYRHDGRIRQLAVAGAILLLLLTISGCRRKQTPGQPLDEVRIGYFGNVTHAQAVLGVSSGEFAEAVKPVALKPKVFNAGPALIEALLAGEIDIGYVGPGPVLNVHARSEGQGVRVLAGAAANGVLIVAGKDSGIEKIADLAGKRIATPQHGNTQDIAARHYVTQVLHQKDSNNILPISNPEQARMMQDRQIDAAWVPEPWGSRLVAEAGAHIVAQEKDLWPGKKFVLTLVITTPQFLKNHPETVARLLAVHHRWTLRLQHNAEQYVSQLDEALYGLSGKKLPRGVLASSIKRTQFLDDPLPETMSTMADWAYELDFASRKGDLTGLIDTRILEKVKQTGRSGP